MNFEIQKFSFSLTVSNTSSIRGKLRTLILNNTPYIKTPPGVYYWGGFAFSIRVGGLSRVSPCLAGNHCGLGFGL